MKKKGTPKKKRASFEPLRIDTAPLKWRGRGLGLRMYFPCPPRKGLKKVAGKGGGGGKENGESLLLFDIGIVVVV